MVVHELAIEERGGPAKSAGALLSTTFSNSTAEYGNFSSEGCFSTSSGQLQLTTGSTSFIRQVKVLMVESSTLKIRVCTANTCGDETRCETISSGSDQQWVTSSCGYVGDVVKIEKSGSQIAFCQVRVLGALR